MELLIGVPTFDDCVCTETMKSIFYLDIDRFVKVDLEFVKGYDCAKARNDICRKALNGGYDFVLMVDGDVILPENAVERLIMCDSAVAFGWYRRGSNKSLTTAFNRHGDYSDDNCISVSQVLEAEEPIRVRGSGMGCALIRTRYLHELDAPFFEYVTYPDGGVLSEDLYFCSKMRRSGKTMLLDPAVECKHVKKVIF